MFRARYFDFCVAIASLTSTSRYSLAQPVLKEAIPAHGVTCFERQLSEVLCKPKILPIKSMALEKVEKIEKEAQQAAKKQRASTAAAGR